MSISQHSSTVALYTQPHIRPHTGAGSREQVHKEWGQDTKKTAFFMLAMASGRTSVYFFPILFHCDKIYTTKNEPFLSVQLGGIGQGNAVVQASPWVHRYLWGLIFNSSGYVPVSRAAGPWDNSMFKFLRSLQFSTAAAPFYIPTHSAQGPNVSTSSPSLVLVVNSDHPAGCEAVRLCGFDLHLPDY